MLDFKKLKKELNNKRIKPEYMINDIEKYLLSVNACYPTTLNEILNYFKQEYNNNKKIRIPNESTSRCIILVEKIEELIKNRFDYLDRGNNSIRLNKRMSRLEEKLRIETEISEAYKYNSVELNEILKKREDILSMNSMTEVAINTLIKCRILQNFTTIFSFSCAFFISFFIDNFLETIIVNYVANIFSKFILTIIFFLLIDKRLKIIEDRFIWRHVTSLLDKAQEVFNLETKRIHFMNSFNNKVNSIINFYLAVKTGEIKNTHRFFDEYTNQIDQLILEGQRNLTKRFDEIRKKYPNDFNEITDGMMDEVEQRFSFNPSLLYNSVFLSMFSYFEISILQICQEIELYSFPKITLENKNADLKEYGRYLFMFVQSKKLISDWSTIMSYYKIRNKLIHQYGYLQERDFNLISLLTTHQEIKLNINDKKFVINDKLFVNKFLELISDFLHGVIIELKNKQVKIERFK